MVSFLQTCLLEYAVHCTGCEIVGNVSGNGNSSGFIRMFVLAMASFYCYQVPSIGFDHLDNLPDFQDGASSTLYLYRVFYTLGFSEMPETCDTENALRTFRRGVLHAIGMSGPAGVTAEEQAADPAKERTWFCLGETCMAALLAAYIAIQALFRVSGDPYPPGPLTS